MITITIVVGSTILKRGIDGLGKDSVISRDDQLRTNPDDPICGVI